MPEPDDCERTGRRRQRRSTWGDLLAKPGAWREARYCLRAARLGEAEHPGPLQPRLVRGSCSRGRCATSGTTTAAGLHSRLLGYTGRARPAGGVQAGLPDTALRAQERASCNSRRHGGALPRCAPCAAGQTASKRNALGSSYCSGNACSSSRRCASARAAAVLTTNAWTWAGPCASE